MEPPVLLSLSHPTRRRSRVPAPLLGLALVLATLVGVGSCGPDRRNEVFGPAGDKIDDPLSNHPTTLTLTASGGGSCAVPLTLDINPQDLTRVADGFNVNGGLWGRTADFGSQKFANGKFHLVLDPQDVTRVIEITGDGSALIPLVGAYADFVPNINAIRANFGVRKGSEMQDLGVPVADDDHCYFLAFLKLGELGFEATSRDFDFAVLGAFLVIDPGDPLVYFQGRLTGVSVVGQTLNRVTMGISGGGHLQSTARAIPDRIVNGHLYFAASMTLGKFPKQVTVSGGTFIRFPDFGSNTPQFVVSVDGSLYLSSPLVSMVLSRVIPGFTSETFHVGDGTSIIAIGADRHNGESRTSGGIRVDFALRSADSLGNLTKLVYLDTVITGTSVASVGGFIDAINPGFGFYAARDVGVTVPDFLDVTEGDLVDVGLTQRISVTSEPPSAFFGLEGGVDIVVATVNVSGSIDPMQGHFNVTGSVGFDWRTGGVGPDGQVSISIAFPEGFTFGGYVELCAGVNTCAPVGFIVTIGPHPTFCLVGDGCL